MAWRKYKIGDFLKRSKIPIDIEDSKSYKRVTIRIKHNGVSLRDEEIGKKIGTKKQFILKGGQFILSKIDARYGAFGIAPDEVDGAIITGNFWAYDMDTSIASTDWINWYTNSKEFYDLCERASSGITHRKYLDEKFFLNHEIELPSVKEQGVILKSLQSKSNKISTLLSELTHQQTLLTRLRQSILQEAVQGQLTAAWRQQHPNVEPASELLRRIREEKAATGKKEKPLSRELGMKEEEMPFDLPEGWVWCRLGDVVELITSGSRGWAQYYAKSGAIFLRMGNLSKDSFELRLDNVQYVRPPKNSEGKRTQLQAGDILISITGDVGMLGLVPESFGEAYINQHTAMVRSKKVISNLYLAYTFLSPCLSEQFNSPQRGIKNSFRLTDVEYLLIPLPPLPEQTAIVARVEALLGRVSALLAESERQRAWAEGLLQAALREAMGA